MAKNEIIQRYYDGDDSQATCIEALSAEIDCLTMYRDYKDKAIKRLRMKQKNQAKTINFLVGKLKAKDERIAKLKEVVKEALVMAKGLWGSVKNHPASQYASDVKYFEQALKENNE